MHHLVIASKNPVKQIALTSGYRQLFDIAPQQLSTIATYSGVAAQPMSRPETRKGAETRAKNAREALPNADFWIGIEGGVEDSPKGIEAFAYICMQQTPVRHCLYSVVLSSANYCRTCTRRYRTGRSRRFSFR